MAPNTFTRYGDGSIASAQPSNEQGRIDSLQALLSCPTNSIHSEHILKEELRAAQQGLPKPVPGCPDIFQCGWHSVKSFSAASYLIKRPSGNILVDSPRYNPILAKRIDEMGGVSIIFLTHRDDVADHRQWARHFGCKRIIHEIEVGHDTKDVEILLKGDGPWDLSGAPIADSAAQSSSNHVGSRDVILVSTPGHTKGHVCLYYSPSKALFSGDHLSQSSDMRDMQPGAPLHIYTDFNWYSVPKQVSSVAKLKSLDFLTVLPGHGRIAQFHNAEEREQAITNLVNSHS